MNSVNIQQKYSNKQYPYKVRAIHSLCLRSETRYIITLFHRFSTFHVQDPSYITCLWIKMRSIIVLNFSSDLKDNFSSIRMPSDT